jgi:hypothetical protein
MHFRHYQALMKFKTALLILGVISLFAIGVEKVMIDEIAREYRHGLGISELYILNFAYLINMIFSLLMFLLLLRSYKLIDAQESGAQNVDEKIFIIAQGLGIFIGLTGLYFTLHMLCFVDQNILLQKFLVFIPFYIMFLMPYMLAIIYWFTIKYKIKDKDWYDEKQLRDMHRASFTTLLVSIPGLALLVLFQVSHVFFVLIYYIFFVLLIFSFSTLYYFKIKDRV